MNRNTQSEIECILCARRMRRIGADFTGKQIYKCDNGAWSKGSTPDATLYDMNSKLKARHGAGPSWTMIDGKRRRLTSLNAVRTRGETSDEG